MARRGSYAKGVAKREEILQTALDVIAREGYGGASVKRLADAVGLSQAGLLHYFDSKEELFTEILRKRDELDGATWGITEIDSEQATGTSETDAVRSAYVGLVGHNADVPGLVQLFARLSVDATDPAHPAHRFFVERGAQTRALFITEITRQQAAGRITPDVAPETIARILQAVSDGMQLQWMLEPEVDMAATVDALFTILEGHPDSPDSPDSREAHDDATA